MPGDALGPRAERWKEYGCEWNDRHGTDVEDLVDSRMNEVPTNVAPGLVPRRVIRSESLGDQRDSDRGAKQREQR